MLQTLLNRIPFHPRIPPRVSHALVAIAKYGSGSVILLVLMLASLWYISAPKNSLYLSFSEQISDKPNLTSVAQDIFFQSRTHLGDAFDTIIELSTLISEDAKYTYTRPTYTLDKPNLRDIVENMGFKYENKSGFYVHFNLVAWLEKLYVRLGWEGRGVEVTGLREEVCTQPTHTNASVNESQNFSESKKSKCWRITVSFRPATIYSDTIQPQTFRGTANELSRDIAVFVYARNHKGRRGSNRRRCSFSDSLGRIYSNYHAFSEGNHQWHEESNELYRPRMPSTSSRIIVHEH